MGNKKEVRTYRDEPVKTLIHRANAIVCIQAYELLRFF
jgi:hypothetical protein